jgi:hypothetical protein
MSLAPTLLLERTIAVSVGAFALLGLAPGSDSSSASPGTAAMSMSGRTPTVIIAEGPVSAPDVGALNLDGRIPFLLRELVIFPALPDAVPTENDLTPTLVWQDTKTPAQAPLVLTGYIPAVIRDGGQNIAPSVGAVSIAGLVPTLVLPAGQDTTIAPNRTELVVLGLIPALQTEIVMAVAAPDLQPVVIGLAPTLAVHYGWQTVELAGETIWLDVPTV